MERKDHGQRTSSATSNSYFDHLVCFNLPKTSVPLIESTSCELTHFISGSARAQRMTTPAQRSVCDISEPSRHSGPDESRTQTTNAFIKFGCLAPFR